ncbi:chaperone protein ClpC2, chloroplastic-like isoform X1 [Carex rostrata]
MAGALVQLAVLPSGLTTGDDSKIRGTWRRNGNASRIVITASLNSVRNSNRFFGSFPLRNQELKCHRGRTRSSRRKLCTVAIFERFTESAMKVIMLAQGESRRLGHSFVGTEQILLGLIGEGTGIAAKVLKSMGINLKDARVEVEKIIGKGSGFVAVEIPFTAQAKRALELVLEEARQMGDNYIGSQHLLLGLLREGGAAARVLESLGADLNSIRTELIAETGRLNAILKKIDTDNSGDAGAPESEG